MLKIISYLEMPKFLLINFSSNAVSTLITEYLREQLNVSPDFY